MLAEALEAGDSVVLGAVPATDPGTWPTEKDVAVTVERWLDMLGLDPGAVAGTLVVSPACGLAGASPRWAREALGLCARAARQVSGTDD